jgi:cytochrome c
MKFMMLSAAAGLIMAGSAQAFDMPPLAKKNNCIACHAIDKKVVGPAWRDIAQKYKGIPGAKAHLTAKIMMGGSGTWGAMPMPGFPKLSQADAGTLVDFVLGLAK